MTIRIKTLDGTFWVKYSFQPGHVVYEKQFPNAREANEFMELLVLNYFISFQIDEL